MQKAKETIFLIDTIKQAAQIIDNNFEVKPKDDKGDLVTNLDYAVEKFVISKIKEAYPNFEIVSEEFNSQSKMAKNCFIIDPIDGTANFAHHIPLWGIQVACVKEGKVCSAVIYLLQLNQFYWADEFGAFCNNERVSVKSFPTIQNTIAVDGKARMKTMVELKKHISHVRSYGSCAVEFAWMAAGKLGGAVFIGNSVWDFVPGCFIAEKAGALIHSKDNLHFAAANENIANLILSAYEEALKTHK